MSVADVVNQQGTQVSQPQSAEFRPFYRTYEDNVWAELNGDHRGVERILSDL